MILPPEPPAMNFTATVINGVIHLPPTARLEEGARVMIRPQGFEQEDRSEHPAALVGRVSSRSEVPTESPPATDAAFRQSDR